MSVSLQPKSFADVILVFRDGGTPTELTIFGSMHDFNTSGLKAVLNAVTAHQSRGHHLGLTHGERTYPTCSFGFIATELSDASAGAIPDWILRNNGYSGLVSTDGSGALRVWTFDIDVTIRGIGYGDSDNHNFVLHDCHPESLDFSDGDPIAFASTYTVYGLPTGDLACVEVS